MARETECVSKSIGAEVVNVSLPNSISECAAIPFANRHWQTNSMPLGECLMRKYNYKSAGWWELRDILLQREDFQNSTKQLRGERWDRDRRRSSPDPGRMSESARGALRYDHDNHGVDYVIYSYYTPIAWHAGNVWRVPDDKYSVTTTQHQNQVKTAISQLPGVSGVWETVDGVMTVRD
jgi:hypothetical protein